MRTFTVTRHCL